MRESGRMHSAHIERTQFERPFIPLLLICYKWMCYWCVCHSRWGWPFRSIAPQTIQHLVMEQKIQLIFFCDGRNLFTLRHLMYPIRGFLRFRYIRRFGTFILWIAESIFPTKDTFQQKTTWLQFIRYWVL